MSGVCGFQKKTGVRITKIKNINSHSIFLSYSPKIVVNGNFPLLVDSVNPVMVAVYTLIKRYSCYIILFLSPHKL